MATSVVLEKVYKKYGDVQVVHGIDLAIEPGEFVVFVGPSGCGKSTLLRMIAGLEVPDSGQILIDDEDQTKTPPQKRDVGFVFQHYAAFKHMTVGENIGFGLSIRKWKKDAIRARVTELLDLVQLTGLADRLPSQLSGGQRQRMALARALAIEPKVLLLDEPFGALDARVRKDLRSWLRRLHEDVHVTTIFVTHDQEEAMDIAEQLVVMNEGRVEQTGSAVELYEEPANEFVMSFVGEVNRIGSHLVRPEDLELSLLNGNGGSQARVERIVRLGFEVRVEVSFGDGQEAWAQITRLEAEQLGLRPGQTVYLRPRQGKDFSGATELVQTA